MTSRSEKRLRHRIETLEGRLRHSQSEIAKLRRLLSRDLSWQYRTLMIQLAGVLKGSENRIQKKDAPKKVQEALRLIWWHE